jgi:hypothetical protein
MRTTVPVRVAAGDLDQITKIGKSVVAVLAVMVFLILVGVLLRVSAIG